MNDGKITASNEFSICIICQIDLRNERQLDDLSQVKCEWRWHIRRLKKPFTITCVLSAHTEYSPEQCAEFRSRCFCQCPIERYYPFNGYATCYMQSECDSRLTVTMTMTESSEYIATIWICFIFILCRSRCRWHSLNDEFGCTARERNLWYISINLYLMLSYSWVRRQSRPNVVNFQTTEYCHIFHPVPDSHSRCFCEILFRALDTRSPIKYLRTILNVHRKFSESLCKHFKVHKLTQFN